MKRVESTEALVIVDDRDGRYVLAAIGEDDRRSGHPFTRSDFQTTQPLRRRRDDAR